MKTMYLKEVTSSSSTISLGRFIKSGGEDGKMRMLVLLAAEGRETVAVTEHGPHRTLHTHPQTVKARRFSNRGSRCEISYRLECQAPLDFYIVMLLSLVISSNVVLVFICIESIASGVPQTRVKPSKLISNKRHDRNCAICHYGFLNCYDDRHCFWLGD